MKKKKKNQAPPAEETARQPEAAEKTAAKPNKILIILLSLVGVAVILAGIILPLALSDKYVSDEGVDPYVRIKLSNGMKLEFEIWENDCPGAATNFIYLARLGYFDDAVIFDSQGGWIRFGGWQVEDGRTYHRGDDDNDFLASIKDEDRIFDTNDRSKNKFGYRLKEDTAKKSEFGKPGVLSFCWERSATEFQISVDSADPSIPGDTGGEWKAAPFAIASNQETLDNLRALSALGRDDGKTFEGTDYSYYRAPLDKDGLIRIKSVTVRKLFADKWKKFDFMNFMYGKKEDGNRIFSSFTWNSSKKKTGAK